MKSYLCTIPAFALLLVGLQAGALRQAGAAEAIQKWRIVNYWSEWCGPCRREIPILNELNARLASSGSEVTVVGVNFDEDPREETMAIAGRMGIEFPTLTMEVVGELQLQAPSVLPTTYILSPDNLVVAKMIGEQNEASLVAQLEQLNLSSEEQLK